MLNFKIFIVEDNIFYANLLKHYLSQNTNNEIHLFVNAEDCLANLHLNPDLITLDYQLPDSTAGELYEKIKTFNSQIEVIIISSQQEIPIVLKLLKQGVFTIR